MVEGGLPVSDRSGPLLGNIAQCQVDQLGDGVIGGESVADFEDLAQRVVERLDGIGMAGQLGKFLLVQTPGCCILYEIAPTPCIR